MKTQKHISRSIFCSLVIVACIVALAACMLPLSQEHTHAWSEWTVSKDPTCTNAGEQTRVCGGCGEKETLAIEPVGHEWREATCVSPKTCVNCGESSGEALAHSYTQRLAVEEALKSAATCTEVAVYYKSCSCGEISKNDEDTFTFGAVLLHVFDQEIATAEALKSAATCKDAAVYYKSCSCGKVSKNDKDTFVSGIPADHVFDQEVAKESALKSAATCTEAAVYYKSCVCGEVSTSDADVFVSGTPVAHTFDQEIAKDAALKSPATPTAAAVYYKSCACGEISKNDKDTFSYGKPGDHTHSYTSKVTPPTCSEYGYTVYSCECGYTYKEVGTTLAEHTWVKNADPLLYLAADATCDEAAEYYYSCSVCGACDDSEGAKTFAEGEALGHDYSWKSNGDGTHTGTCQHFGCQKTVNEACTGGTATCTQKAICQVCQEYYGEVLGHSWKDGAIISTATCTTAGQKTQICQNDGCRATTTVTVPATGHSYQTVVTAPTCTTQGYTTYTCQNCTHSYTGDYQAMAEHSFGEWTQTKSPTCTETGIRTRECSCGAIETESIATIGHNYTSSVTPATCTTQGYTTYTCQNAGCTHSYLGNYVANSHKWNIEAPTCTQDQICSVCQAKNEATGHSYELIGSEAASCTKAATNTYQCKHCEDSYVESIGTPVAHDVAGVTPTLAPVDGATCLFVEHYACADCGADVVGEQVEKHNKYAATIQSAATCTSEGVKLLTCADCGETKTETIPVDTTLGHTWVMGDVVDGKRTDACSICGETKTVTIVTENQTNKAEDLKDTELSVGGTNINFGDAAESIGNQTQNDVTIGAGTLDEDEKQNLGLDKEQLAQIGDNPIYNFTVTDTENNLITNFGDDVYVTISIPYTLKEGEDIDSIAVWFISDTGELEAIPATYNNGYITFKTNHFSYYTVTDLTPAERCALYGHNFKNGLPVDPTCTESGYTLLYCIRCHYSEKKVPVDPIGHDFQTEIVRNATCMQEGLIRHTCSNCNSSYEERTPSLEHDYQFLSQTDATCTVAGTVTYQCSVCQSVKTEETAPLGHNCKAVAVMKSTCTAQGYTIYACQNGDCTYSYQGDYQGVAAHTFGAWAITTPATCKTVGEQTRICTGCNRTESQVIPATNHAYVSVVTAPTCDAAGYTTYTCSICQNSYTGDHRDATGHNYIAVWEWAEDKASAQITITCQNAGCRYNTQPVIETVASECTVFDSTEKKEGRKEYSVHFEFDGESFRDVKSEIIPIKVHDHSNCEWQYNKFNHWYKCSDGRGNSQKIPHKFDNGTVTKVPTCQSAGSVVYKCECGFEKTEVLPKTDVHTAGDQTYHDGEKHWNVCTVCGQKFNENKHEWDDGTETKSATCTSKGSVTYLCACGATKITELPALGHTGLIIPGKAATCTENGLTEGKKCSVCDLTITPQTVIPALGHKYQDGYCIHCGVSEIAPHDHIFDNACDTDCNFAGCKFTRDTKHVFDHDCDELCDECGYMRKTEHKFDNACDPDCNVAGCGYIRMIYTHYYDHECDADCNECGSIRPVDHFFDNVCDMTCNNANCGFVRPVSDHEYHGGYCIYCGVSEVEPHEHFFADDCDNTCEFTGCHFMRVAPHAYANDCDTECDACGYMRWVPYHNYIETERVEATCTTDGYVTRVCSSCNDTFTDILYAHGHFFEDFVVLKEATCTEEGERQGVCTSCGETVTEIIYANGHDIDYAYVEFANIGITCGGWSSRETCKTCGKCVYFNSNDYYCAWSLTDSDEQNDEYTYTCENCGAVKKLRAVNNYSDACHYQRTETYEYYVGGELVWYGSNQWDGEEHHWTNTFEMQGTSCEDGYYVTAICTECQTVNYTNYYTYHNTYSVEEYDFTEFGACYGHLYICVCPCGENRTISVNYCGLNYVSEETYTDGTGTKHTVETYACPACGLTRVRDYYTQKEGCYSYSYETYTFKMGDTVIGSYEDRWQNNSYHQYVYSYVFDDETNRDCEAGVSVTQTCRNCDYRMEDYRTYHHNDVVEYYDFTEYGACYGYYRVYKCPCQKNAWEDYHYCNLEYVSTETYPDNAGVEHTLETYACPTCGLTRVRDCYIQRVGCYSYSYEVYTFQMGNTAICSYSRKWENDSYHDLEYTYVFDDANNKNCEAGVTITQTCRNCDYQYEYHSNSHSVNRVETYDLTEWGACYGYVHVHSCPCGEYRSTDYYCCDLNYVSETYYPDAQGRDHTVRTDACSTCGLERVWDSYDQKEGCYTYRYYHYTLKMAGEEICSYDEKSQVNSHHVYEYTYVFDDENNKNCEAGVTITQTCRNCDYSSYDHISHHSTHYLFDLRGYYDCCEEHYAYVSGCACGKEYQIYFESYTFEFDEQSQLYTCPNCAVTVAYDVIEQEQDCTWVKTTSMIVELAGVELYSGSKEESYAYHNFGNINATVSGDVTTVTSVCQKCGLQNSVQTVRAELEDHDGAYYYDYYFTPDVTAFYTIKGMADRDTYVNLYRVVDGELVSVAYNDDGWGNQFFLSNELIAGTTYVYRVRFYNSSNSGSIDFMFQQGNMKSNACRHTVCVDFATLLDGSKNCEDGVLRCSVCKECGVVNYVQNDYMHTSILKEEYLFYDLGACYGYLRIYECPCGENRNVSTSSCPLNYVSETYYTDAQGYKHTVRIDACSICGLTLEQDYYEQREGCYLYRYYTNTYKLGGVVIGSYQQKNEVNSYHKYEYTYVFSDESNRNCEAGVTVTQTCRNCDYSSTDYYNWHNGMLVEEYDFADFGACSGYYRVYECPCGEYTSNEVNHCYLSYVSETSYTDAQGISHIIRTDACSTCGLTRITDYHDQREGCYLYRYYEYTYKIGGVDICSYQQKSEIDSYHQCEYTYVFNDASNRNCEAGVTVTQTCRNCDYSREDYHNWHSVDLIERYEFADYGACHGHLYFYSCPCGKSSYSEANYCNLSYVAATTYNDAQGREHIVDTYACSTCGLTRVEDYYDQREGCYTYRYVRTTLQIGNTTFRPYENTAQINSYHNYEYNYVFSDANNQTCEAGVTVTQTCRDCDVFSEWYVSHHSANLVERYELAEWGACHGYIHFYECPCGKNDYVDYIFCANANGGTESTYTDAQGREHNVTTYGCSTCGLTYTQDRYSQREGCHSYVYSTYTFKIGNTKICSYEDSWKDNYEYHEYEYTFVFDDPANQNCLAGVTMITTCRNCDYRSELHDTGHASHLKQDYDLTKWGACQGYVSFYECPCGEYQSQNTYFRCSFTHESTTEYTDAQGRKHHVETYVCITCGLTRVRDYYVEREGCYDYNYSHYTVKMGNTEICSYDEKWQQGSYHHYEYTYVFNDETNRNCEAGVTVTQTCRDCDYYSSYYRTYHNADLVERYEFTDYGACLGYLHVYKCPCGEQSSISFNCCTMDVVEKTTYTDAQGREHTVETVACSTCGLTRVQDYYDQKEGCYTHRYSKYTYKIGNVTIASYNEKWQAESHHDYQYTYVFADETNKTCTAGVTITQTCRNCEHFNEWHSTHHGQNLTAQYDLKDYGAEGGYIKIYECPCGYSTYSNFSDCSHGSNYTSDNYVDEQGTRWYVNTYQSVSSKCDCNVRFDSAYYYTYDRENCIRTTHYIESVVVGDLLVMFNERSNCDSHHDYRVSVSLAPGATNCEDGVVATYTCYYCGESYTTTSYSHNTYEKERIDLAQYGSVCGGYLSIYSCACGIYGSWSVDNCDCAFEQKGTNNWVTGDINNGQYTANGWNSFYTNSYIYTCFITHPDQCGFVIRYSEYWKKNKNCSATQYVTLQFGYDEETGKHLGERTIQLGTKTYHNYESSSIPNGTKYECTDCGSYYTHCYYYNADGFHERTEQIFVNTLDDGCSKYHEEIYEYYTDGDSRWIGRNKSVFNRTINADGSEHWQRSDNSYGNYAAPFGENAYSYTSVYTDSNGYTETYDRAYTYYKGYEFCLHEYNTGANTWSKNDYTYRFEDGCERTCVYTSSDGDTRTNTEEAHPVWHYETVISPTCTQYGLYAHRCPVCEEIRGGEVIKPTAHNWVRIPMGIYYCYNCGLQNSNGASGNVVMEDFTKQYGNGTAYVIGYWKRIPISFTPYVTIYLHTPIVINGIPEKSFVLFMNEDQFHFVNDEYVGLYVNIADIRAAVADLCRDYGVATFTPDMYDVAISFVPDGADGRFDYAIVFGDLVDSGNINYIIKDDEFFSNYVAEGAYVDYTVVSDVTTEWIFESYAQPDACVELLDESGKQIAYDDDSANYNNNFLLKYTLEAGKTYTVRVRWLNTQNAGYIPVAFDKQ